MKKHRATTAYDRLTAERCKAGREIEDLKRLLGTIVDAYRHGKHETDEWEDLMDRARECAQGTRMECPFCGSTINVSIEIREALFNLSTTALEAAEFIIIGSPWTRTLVSQARIGAALLERLRSKMNESEVDR